MSSAKRMAGSVAWGAGGAAGQALFQLLVFIALARTLSPQAFGVVAIATAVIDLLNFIGRGGITEVLVQRRTLDPRAMNAGFFASLAGGLVLTVTLILAAPLFAQLFDTPELQPVMTALAPICLFYAAGAVYEGILRHGYQFKQLALRNTTATVFSGVIALALALTGWGVWALVAQRLVGTVWSLAAMVVTTRWWPRLDFDPRELVTQLRQGSAVALSSVLGAGNQRIVDLVVGYFLGPVLLGYLRIAWRMLDLLYEIVVRPIANVSLTALPKARHAGRGLEAEYLALIRYAAVIIVPMFLGLSVVATELVPLIFGEQWRMSAHLLSVLCFIGLFTPLTYFRSSALIAQGAYRHVLLVNLGDFVLAVLCALAFTPFGLISATIGYVARAAITAPLTMLYLEKIACISAGRTLRAALPATFSACCMLAGAEVVRLALPEQLDPAWRIATLITAGALAYAATILLTDRKLLTDAARLRADA